MALVLGGLDRAGAGSPCEAHEGARAGGGNRQIAIDDLNALSPTKLIRLTYGKLIQIIRSLKVSCSSNTGYSS